MRDDGVLLALTYMKEQQIFGWSRQQTHGRVLSVATISGVRGDDLLLVVEREIQGGRRVFLERLAEPWQDADPVEEAFFVDCGITVRLPEAQPAARVTGLDHLEGCTLSVLADGSPVEGCVVRGGSIELPYAASVVQAGLPYASVLAPLPVESDTQQGSTLGQGRSHGFCSLRLHRSVGGKYGPSREELYDLPFVPEYWGRAVRPFSGDVVCAPAGGWENSATLWLVQDRPLPLRVLALVLDVTF